MVLTRTQIRSRYDWKERSRRMHAEKNTVYALTTIELRNRLNNFITKDEIKQELERRRCRLYYHNVVSDPNKHEKYLQRKRIEYRIRNAKSKS